MSAARGSAGFTLTETLIALALLGVVAASTAAAQLQHQVWVRRAAVQGTVVRLAREQLEVVRIDPSPGTCWALTAAERAAGYDCRVTAAPCPLGPVPCASLAAVGATSVRIVSSGPDGVRVELRSSSPAALLGRLVEGR